MSRIQRMFEAEGTGVKTLQQLAELGGYRNTCTVYNRINKGEPIAGKFWRKYDQKDHDLTDPIEGPKVEPLKRAIICVCGSCAGRVWKPGEMHITFPAIVGMRIWDKTFEKINQMTGHDFQYEPRRQKQPRNWKSQQIVTARPTDPARSPHVLASSDEAQDLMPINPNFRGTR